MVKKLLESYEYTSTIRAGGMGAVFSAGDLALSQEAAVKVIEAKDE